MCRQRDSISATCQLVGSIALTNQSALMRLATLLGHGHLSVASLPQSLVGYDVGSSSVHPAVLIRLN